MASSEQSGDVLTRSDPRRFSQRQKPFRFQYKIFTRLRGLLEKDEKHRIKHRDLDVQFDQSGEAVDGFSKVYGFR